MTSQTSLIVFFLLCVSQLHAQQILLSEDFESETIPSGWTQSTNASDGGWIMGTNTQLQSGYWPISDHGNIIATNDDACDCDKSVDYLIMPEFDFSDAEVVALQFVNYYDGGTLFGGTEDATIEYSLDGGVNWEILEEIVGTEDGQWDTQFVDLSSLVGNESVLVAFHYYDDGEWLFGWAIDDVLVFQPEGLDLAMGSLNTSENINVQDPTLVSGVVNNNGAEVITSFDLTWMLNGNSFTTNFSGLSIAPLGSYTFSHPDLLELMSSGTYELTVTIS
ncbi:MAG: choice-of-anchor J domain-containing protein, partial [Flavobacteriales bacterium]